MAWIYGTDWIRRTGNWIGSGVAAKYNDGVEITAMAVAPIVNPLADGRVPYFQAKPEDEYIPEVYQKAGRIMARGLPENSSQEQRDQASLEAARANLEVQQKTGDYQSAGVQVAILPVNVLTMGIAGVGTNATTQFATGVAASMAIDTALEEASHGIINAANHGNRPTDTLGTTLIRVANPDALAPNTVDVAQTEHARIAMPLALQAEFTKSIDKLFPDGVGQMTPEQFIARLDHDGNHSLTIEDANEARRILGNEIVAKAVLDELRTSHGITFENQPIPQSGSAAVGTQASSSPSTNASPTPATAVTQPPAAPATNNPADTQPDFLTEVWNSLMAMLNQITSVFYASGDSSTQPETNPSMAQTTFTFSTPTTTAGYVPSAPWFTASTQNQQTVVRK